MKRFWNSYFISNGVLILVYILMRFFIAKPSNLIVTDEYLPRSLSSNREVQVMCTGTIILFVKYIKSPTWESFLMNFFFFYKCCFIVLLYFSNVWAMIWYLLICLIVWMLFKMPLQITDNKFINITSVSQLESEVLNSNKAWVILFYSPQSSESIETISLWCEMSLKYTNNSLKFGKVDVSESKFLAKKCAIDPSGFSRQIPSLILYSEGKELKRFPPVNSSGEVGMVINYKYKEIIKYLGIDRLYLATRNKK
jgi:Thioredoxin